MSNSYPADPLAHMMGYPWPFPQPYYSQQVPLPAPPWPNSQQPAWGQIRYHYHTRDGGPPNMGKPISKQEEADLSSQTQTIHQSPGQYAFFQQPAEPPQQPYSCHASFGRGPDPRGPWAMTFQIFHDDLVNSMLGCPTQHDGTLHPDARFAGSTRTYSSEITLGDFLGQLADLLPANHDNKCFRKWSGVEELEKVHPTLLAFTTTGRRHTTIDPNCKLVQKISVVFGDARAKAGTGPIYVMPCQLCK